MFQPPSFETEAVHRFLPFSITLFTLQKWREIRISQFVRNQKLFSAFSLTLFTLLKNGAKIQITNLIETFLLIFKQCSDDGGGRIEEELRNIFFYSRQLRKKKREL